jgi:metal-sulfur cluster biosynthetic enzyme
MSDLERQAWARLASVMDPETGISVVEMGLIRRVRPSEHGLSLVMTLTHAGCPLGAVILDRVREALRPLCPEGSIEIALSFDPPWTPQSITPAGRAALSR